MSAIETELIQQTALVGLGILSVGMALALFRMIRGPAHADRIIALDLLSVLVVAMIALYSIYTRQAVFLDAAIVYALVAFLGTAAFARYIERVADRIPTKTNPDTNGGNHD